MACSAQGRPQFPGPGPKGLPPAPRQGTQAPRSSSKPPAGQGALTPAAAALPAAAAAEDDGLAPEELEVFDKVAAMMQSTTKQQQQQQQQTAMEQVPVAVVPARASSPCASTFTSFNAAAAAAGATTNSNSPISAGRRPGPAAAAAAAPGAGMLPPPPPLPLPWPCMQPFHPGMLLLPPLHPAAAFQHAAWMHHQQQLMHAQAQQQQQQLQLQWQQQVSTAAVAAPAPAPAAAAEDPDDGAPVPWSSFVADDKSDDLDVDLAQLIELPGEDPPAARRRSARAAPPAAAPSAEGSSRAKRVRVASANASSAANGSSSSKKKGGSGGSGGSIKKHSDASGSLGVAKQQQPGSGVVKKPAGRIVLKGSTNRGSKPAPARAASAASLAGVFTPPQQQQPQLRGAQSTPNLDLGVLHSLDDSCLSGADAASDDLLLGVWGTAEPTAQQEPMSDDDLDSLLPWQASTHPGLDCGSSML